MILALVCKAVAAGQIAVMGNMKTKGFYNCLSLLKIHYKIPVNILGQKLLCINELLDILQSLCDLFFTVGTIQAS